MITNSMKFSLALLFVFVSHVVSLNCHYSNITLLKPKANSTNIQNITVSIKDIIANGTSCGIAAISCNSPKLSLVGVCTANQVSSNAHVYLTSPLNGNDTCASVNATLLGYASFLNTTSAFLGTKCCNTDFCNVPSLFDEKTNTTTTASDAVKLSMSVVGVVMALATL